MDNRTPEEKAAFRERADRWDYIYGMTKNRRNRLDQYQRKIGKKLSLAEIKERFGGRER